MCGICGEWHYQPQIDLSGHAVQVMTDMMARRGPDDEGYWSDGRHCSLGFRRLAILDLSNSGHQPMLTQDGRYAIAFNGEVYNFREIRQQLSNKGINFKSTGDSEVVLYALAQWGPEALASFNGMFALAFYDKEERRLLLARDQAGIKPLYYMLTPQGAVFASQYNQILAHPWRKNLKISPNALGLYLRLGYIPSPLGLLENTYMMEPGTWQELTVDGQVKRGRFFEFPSYREPDLRGEEAYQAVDEAISRAVRRQLVSDVPVAAFLSGGIDSPLVTAKMVSASNRPVKAFTIGTNGDRFDESPEAMAYGRKLGVEHIVEQMHPDQSLEMLDEVVYACGEPFADHSIFPTMLVSRLAARHVKVMLSGDGGDELFWGYDGRFASVLQKAADFRRPSWWRSARWGLKKSFNLGNGYANLRWSNLGDWYRSKHTHFPENWLKVIFPDLPEWPADFGLFNYSDWRLDQTAQWLRWNEFVGHLTMVLLKVDRASMHHSLEVRVPLLDREVIEVATRVDWQSCLDIQRVVGKLPLRHALERQMGFQTRSKRGFDVPIDAWLRGPLRRKFEESMLGRKEIMGLTINQNALQKMFQQHLSGQSDYARGLWILLSLALWEKCHYHS